MLRIIGSGLLLASAAAAHNVLKGWEYVGCATVPAKAWDSYVYYADGYTPEECQGSCAGYAYAGVYYDTCKCGDAIGNYTKIDDAKCGIYDPDTCGDDHGVIYKAAESCDDGEGGHGDDGGHTYPPGKTSTAKTTITYTITSCPPVVTDCPIGKVTTTVIPITPSGHAPPTYNATTTYKPSPPPAVTPAPTSPGPVVTPSKVVTAGAAHVQLGLGVGLVAVVAALAF